MADGRAICTTRSSTPTNTANSIQSRKWRHRLNRQPRRLDVRSTVRTESTPISQTAERRRLSMGIGVMGTESATRRVCIVCGYNLRGLPAECTCPECGFENDDSVVTWRCSRRFWRQRALPFLGMGLGAIGISLPLLRPMAISTLDVRLRLVVLVSVAVVIAVVWWAVRSRPFVAVSRSALAFRFPFH